MEKMSRDGGFSDPSYTSIGDPYAPKKDPPRGLGGTQKPFLTSPAKKGASAATFGPGMRKHEALTGEYLEQYKVEGKRRLENTRKFVKPSGFTYSNPTPKHTGSGDYFGSFDKYERSDEELKKAEEANNQPKPNPKDRVFEKKNILTNAGKRGTYGYPNTLLGEPTPAIAAEYGSMAASQRQDAAKHRALVGERKPFKSVSHGVDCFDAHEHTPASKVYGWDDECRVKPVDPIELMSPKERAEARATTRKAWKPNDVVKHGPEGAFNDFPEQLPDPYDERVVNKAMLPARRNPVKVAMQHLPISMQERKAFKPSSGPKSKLTKSTCLVGISKHKL